MDDSRKWWKARNSRGHVAHVPHTIITPFAYSNDNGDTFNNPLFTQNVNRNFSNRQSSVSIFVKFILSILLSIIVYYISNVRINLNEHVP